MKTMIPANFSKKLDRTETINILSKFTETMDGTESLQGLQLDQKAAAAFLEKNAKKMRFVALNAGFRSIQLLVEEIYYHAYEESHFKNNADYKSFRENIPQNNY